MKLQQAIKQLVAQFGDDIVTEVKLAHLVADLNGYEEYPAMKQVIKDSLQAGYGKKLLEFYKQDPKSVPHRSIDLAKAFAKESHYKQELVSYGFDSILFGLGCSTSINEPLSQQEGNILDKLADQQAAYQKQYLDLLDRLLTKPDNMLRDAPGYYTTEALNKLYAVEAKICALQQQLNSADSGWCKQKREEKLVYYQKQKSNFVRKTADDLKKKYLHVLSSSLVIPKKLFIKRSGYYTADTLNKLSSLETDIKQAYYQMNKSYDDWCKKETDNYLAKYKVKATSIAWQFLGKIGVPAAICMGALGTGISYRSSFDAIDQFEDTLQQAAQSASEGNYDKALQLFSDAKKGYNASFRPSHYHELADEYITANIDRVTTACNQLIEQGQLVEASVLLNKLPPPIVAANEANLGKVNTAKATLATAIEKDLDNLISNISQHKGHLDAKAKAHLEELLKINPNHYWLNFIKNKEK